MTYASPHALRMALEQRLLNQSRESNISLDRLRRRVIFERIVARLHYAEPGRWVLKGGMAMEVRLQNRARLTKDIDLGLRDEGTKQSELHERIVEALLGGKPFGCVQLDISPRTHELEHTDQVALPNSLAFANIDTTTIEIIDVNRHAAEKLHAMQKDFGDRENSRVRDLVDLMIFLEHDLLEEKLLKEAVIRVWQERENSEPPHDVAPPPVNWADRYDALAAEHDVEPMSFTDAAVSAGELWRTLFTDEPVN